MKKVIFCFILLFSPFLIWADETDHLKTMKSIQTDKDFHAFIQYYYTNPRPDLVPNGINYLILKKLNAIKNNQRHFVPFFGEVFKANDSKIKPWFSNLKNYSDHDIYIFCQALHWTSSQNAKDQIQLLLKKTNNQELKTAIEHMINNFKPANMITLNVSSGDQLDMIWNCFFATGDDQYVRKMIGLTDENMTNINTISLYSAARMSIGIIARTHTKVYKICEDEYEKGDANRKKVLAKFISK